MFGKVAEVLFTGGVTEDTPCLLLQIASLCYGPAQAALNIGGDL